MNNLRVFGILSQEVKVVNRKFHLPDDAGFSMPPRVGNAIPRLK